MVGVTLEVRLIDALSDAESEREAGLQLNGAQLRHKSEFQIRTRHRWCVARRHLPTGDLHTVAHATRVAADRGREIEVRKAS